MTVAEAFEEEQLDLNFIPEIFGGEEGSYWKSADNFIGDNWDRHTEELSIKQHKWFTKILEDCVEKRIEGDK